MLCLLSQMEILPLLLLSFLFYPHTSLSAELCKQLACGKNSPELRFPFYLENHQTGFCGYQGFGLLCNQTQPILNLPNSGNYAVKRIDYATQDLFIDPGFCTPGRILSFTLRNSPYRGEYTTDYTIYNCSERINGEMYSAARLDCLGGDNYTVVAVPEDAVGAELPTFCRNVTTVGIPVQLRVKVFGSSVGLREDLQLTWDVPNCKYCESKGGICGLKNQWEFDTISCTNKRPRRGLPRSAKYGIIVGVGIPGLVFIIGLACFVCNKFRAFSNRHRLDTELSTAIMITPEQALFRNGLDGSTIESYPKTVLGESCRLPKPNDSTCPICLSKYLPKDTLRTIPECNHYFHAKCIDEWLKLNATCPVCRNTPESSSVVTPCSSVSSTTTSSTTL
ncbi:hypothetical protein LguiB_034813 [Lonicera macranthoides]